MLDFEFDDLAKLYQEDPEAFELKRQEIINDFIDHLPNEECKLRARQFQFRIDSELHKYKDPVAKMNRMVELFWEGVIKFQHTLDTCAKEEPNPIPPDAKDNPKAPVVDFKPKG